MQIWASFLEFYAMGPFGPLFWLVVVNALTTAVLGAFYGRSC